MAKKVLGFLIFLLFCMIWVQTVQGQVDVSTATLKGTVSDQNGAVVSGATVTAISVDKGISKSVKTSSDGVYQIPLLQPGRYQLQIEAQGFTKEVISGLELTVGQIQVYDATLSVGAVNTIIDITADAPLIQVEQTQ